MITLDGPSLHLGRISGIPIKVHWTFSLFIAFISYIAYRDQVPQAQLLGFYSVVFLLFIFVIMHEFGHAYAGRKYGIKTKDVIISPIGGIARLESIPHNPIHELVIALAGPAVNVALALLFFLFQFTFSEAIFPSGLQMDLSSIGGYIGFLLTINIVLVIFNLVPAFPMDGGRVLRALLDLNFNDRYKATKWAVRIGQFLAIGFVLIGAFTQNYMLVFVGFFVFISAKSELRQTKIFKVMNATLVEEIVQPVGSTLQVQNTIKDVVQIDSKKNYLVLDDMGKTIGTLPSLLIDKAIQQKRLDLEVGEVFIRSVGSILSSSSLKETFDVLNQSGCAIVEVVDEIGNKKGVVDRQLLNKFISSI